MKNKVVSLKERVQTLGGVMILFLAFAITIPLFIVQMFIKYTIYFIMLIMAIFSGIFGFQRSELSIHIAEQFRKIDDMCRW